MLSLINVSLDGELAKQRGEANAPAAPNETTATSSTTTSTSTPPPYPSPADGHAPRPKRPTFLPIKNHARPALTANDKQSPVGPGKGLEERSHASLPPARSATQRTASCSSLGSLPHSMYQLPAVPTPTVPTSSAGTVAGITVVTSATTSTGATTTTTAASTATVSTSNARGPAAANDALVSRRNKALYGEFLRRGSGAPVLQRSHSREEGERLVRRVSYLKATSGDRMYPDSDLDSDTDDRSGVRVGVPTEADGVECVTPHTPGGRLLLGHPPSPDSVQSAVVRQGTLHVKLTHVDGKRAADRSWKAVWAVMQGRAIIFYKDRQHAMQTPLGVEDQISLRGAEVEVASDYTKRRNVLRLATPGGSQLLLQADTPPEMFAWLSSLQNNCATQDGEGDSKAPMNNNISPQTGNKAMRKLTSLRTRSPTGQSPSIKTRKPGSVESNTSPKSKTWRGHLKRPFMKKVQSGSPAATPTMPLPEGATIGVCLEDCPQSHDNEFVPLLVSLCVGVVESRGLQTQGIYRIPGNKASVTYLTEMINRDAKSIDYDDSRWCDVNVISSMLKQFFQKLPDPLFTCELYPLFIEASKVDDPKQRMLELKKLVHELPDHHYETLRFLIMHLNNIVTNSDTNKMDVRNLAIVFGPTLVRSGDDNMVTMVTDMSHQCRIVETLISYANWFFMEDEGEEFSPPLLEPAMSLSPAADSFPMPPELDTPSSQALLLHNIPKVEGNIKGDMKKDIVSSIISAANRKVHKGRQKKAQEDKPVDESKFSDRDGGFEERDIDKEAELRKQRLMAKEMEHMVELPDPKPMSERKISNMSLMSVQSHMSGGSNVSQHEGERTSGSGYKLGLPVDDPRLYSIVKKEELASPPVPLTLPSNAPTMAAAAASQQSSQFTPETSSLFGDEVAIRSYAGLSASTQERIRRFEMETRAMLHRDLTRHRRETERRDVERQRLEELWQRAKQDMESEDILDQLADNPTEVVRKISDYSWRLQGLSENVGQRGSLASQGSTTSPQAVLSAALSHHPLSNTSFTPTTNATTQILNGPEAAMPRCGSLDSLRDGPHVPHDDGSDLLSAITATFEEKMRSLQESPLGLTASDGNDSSSSSSSSSQDSSPEEPPHHPEQLARGSSGCRLYRDPSLHRRRTSPRTSVTSPTTVPVAAATATPSHISQIEDNQSSSLKESDNKILSEEVKPGVKVKRSDSLTKSEKTENNLKEKTEKRARELKRTDTQESLNEKRPKEMKRSDLLEGRERLQEPPRKSDMKENISAPPRRSSDIRSRRHNVKELKEKFEQNTNNQANSSPMKPSNNLYGNSSSSMNKGSKAAMRRTGYRGPIKRRHTVGGTKDLAKWAWLHSVEVSKSALRATRLTAWERLQPLVVDERLNTDRSLEAWLTHERIRTSSPDLSRPQQLVLPPYIVGDKENLHRRLSVQEATLNPLYPVLESHV